MYFEYLRLMSIVKDVKETLISHVFCLEKIDAANAIKMNQAEITRLISGLKIKVNTKPMKLRNPYGPRGTLESLRPNVTSLVNDERIQMK